MIAALTADEAHTLRLTAGAVIGQRHFQRGIGSL